MMVCHAWYPAFDPDKTPASLSRSIVTDLLVSELGFDGLIMTDDLDMGAIINEVGFVATIDRAISAGNHLAMICHRTHLAEEALAALEKVKPAALDQALAGISRFKPKLAAPKPFLRRTVSCLGRRGPGASGGYTWSGESSSSQPGRWKALACGNLLEIGPGRKRKHQLLPLLSFSWKLARIHI